MLEAARIAWFLLATATPNGQAPQRRATHFHSRALPIVETYGAFFPHVYFSFGNGPADFRFLQDRCVLEKTWGEPFDSAYPKRAAIRNATDEYSCAVQPSEWRWNASWSGGAAEQAQQPQEGQTQVARLFRGYQARRRQPVRALYHANCTGKYFGLGPTCRCQEATRFFLTQPRFRDVEWFVFMDDDLHYRPFALLSLLAHVQRNESLFAAPLALVAGMGMQGFTMLKDKQSASGQHACRAVEHHFGYAQPAIMNRRAMQTLALSIHSDGLTRLHRFWGGSHDSLLGMLLWMHRVPTYSLLRVYCGSPISVLRAPVAGSLRDSTCIIFHRVMSRIIYRFERLAQPDAAGRKSRQVVKDEFASQFDVAVLLGEEALYELPPPAPALLEAFAMHQARLGKRSVAMLELLPQDTVAQTAFAPLAARLGERFEPFTPAHCAAPNVIAAGA